MVSVSLMLTLKEAILVITAGSSLRLGDVIFLGMECVEFKRFLRFFKDDSTDLCEILFQDLRENT